MHLHLSDKSKCSSCNTSINTTNLPCLTSLNIIHVQIMSSYINFCVQTIFLSPRKEINNEYWYSRVTMTMKHCPPSRDHKAVNKFVNVRVIMFVLGSLKVFGGNRKLLPSYYFSDAQHRSKVLHEERLRKVIKWYYSHTWWYFKC